ncbi:hypothetical protein SAMN05660493_01525 [Epilithonimonas bovis DSM 19482]|uniref:Uncharacterized protein n=1 Tax=Epilithonimonas bovis DSM 19482 TaxID=1121284 RepID=A0A1U7PYA9_9FLAO|nr:hypothetical protein SAMN05660493_01525 [Epilithonimonas bovis DSM 19482]
MKLPNQILINKICWVNRYFEKINKLFEVVHNHWVMESNKNFGSIKHKKLSDLKKRIDFKIKLLSRYSAKLTNEALRQMNT